MENLEDKRTALVTQRDQLRLETRAPTDGLRTYIDDRINSVEAEIASAFVQSKLAEKDRGKMPLPLSAAEPTTACCAVLGAVRERGAPFTGASTPRQRSRLPHACLLTSLPSALLCEILSHLKPCDLFIGGSEGLGGGIICACRSLVEGLEAEEAMLWDTWLRAAAQAAQAALDADKGQPPCLDVRRVLAACAEVPGRTRARRAYFFLQLQKLPLLIAQTASRRPRRAAAAASAAKEAVAVTVTVGVYGGGGGGGGGDDEDDDDDGYGLNGGEQGSEESGEEAGASAAAAAARAVSRPHEAAAAGVTRPSRRCVLALDRRCYDATPFLQDHPGGRSNLVRYGGRDASAVFDVFGHSDWAHAFMRRHLLVFDAVAFAGRRGAPVCASARFLRYGKGAAALGGGGGLGRGLGRSAWSSAFDDTAAQYHRQRASSSLALAALARLARAGFQWWFGCGQGLAAALRTVGKHLATGGDGTRLVPFDEPWYLDDGDDDGDDAAADARLAGARKDAKEEEAAEEAAAAADLGARREGQAKERRRLGLARLKGPRSLVACLAVIGLGLSAIAR